MLRATTILLFATLLAGSASTPLPFKIEWLGNLPPDRYPALERLTASAETVVGARGAQLKTAFPEPYWVYSFDPGLELKGATLQINAFSALSRQASEVATDLRPRLIRDLTDTKLFGNVGSGSAAGAFALDGVVVVADTVDDTYGNKMARTQMEATVSRNGKVVGVMQINSAQFDSALDLPVASLLISAAGGSRVGSLSGKTVDVLTGVAAGRAEGIDTESSTRRYLRTSPPRTPSVFDD